MSTGGQPGDQTAMIEDYVATREDERSFQATQVALASLALTTLGALAGLIGRYVLHHPKPQDVIPPGLLVLTPLVPLALFAMFAQAGAQATLRTHYLRDIETQLTGGTATLGTWVSGSPTPSPSFIRLVGALVGLKHGHRVYRLITVLQISIAMSAFVVILILIGTHVPGPWASAMAVTYASVILTLGYLMWTATGRGQAFYDAAHKRLAMRTAAAASGHGTLAAPPSGGSTSPAQTGSPAAAAEADAKKENALLQYVLLPRPADLIKGLYYFAGLVLASFLGDTPDRTVAEWWTAAIWGWVVLEFLSYQARYQWNDVRGLARDKLHPMATNRRRLPDTPDSVQASGLVAAWRIAAALVLALGAPEDTRGALLIGIALIFVLAALYETARHYQHPILVITLVALGYPLRFCLGLAVAGYDWSNSGVLAPALGVVAFAAVGWSTVGLTWTLEADETRQSGQPPTGHHQRLWQQAKLALNKPDPYKAPLKVGYPLLTVPNLAQLLACAAGACLTHLATPAPWSGRTGALVLVATCAMLILILLGVRGWKTLVAILASLAAITSLSFWSADHPTALWAPLFWVVFAGFYVSFRAQTYTELTSAGKAIIFGAFVGTRLAGGWLTTGRRTIKKDNEKWMVLDANGQWVELEAVTTGGTGV